MNASAPAHLSRFDGARISSSSVRRFGTSSPTLTFIVLNAYTNTSTHGLPPPITLAYTLASHTRYILKYNKCLCHHRFVRRINYIHIYYFLYRTHNKDARALCDLVRAFSSCGIRNTYVCYISCAVEARICVGTRRRSVGTCALVVDARQRIVPVSVCVGSLVGRTCRDKWTPRRLAHVYCVV